MYDLIRRPGRLVALTGLLLATAGAGLIGGPAAAQPSVPAGPKAAVDTTATNAPTTRDRIVRTAYAELNNETRNHEVNSSSTADCNYYTGAMGRPSSACPKSGWGNVDWCADFVRYVWKVAGNIEHQGDLNSFANSVREYGQKYKTWHDADSGYQPQPGDAFTETDSNGNGRADHTGLVVENLGGGKFRTIEGNVPDRIKSYVRSVSDSDVWGFAEPMFAETDMPEQVFRVGAAGSLFNGSFQSFFRRADNHALYHVYTPSKGWTNHDLGGSVAAAPTTTIHRGDLWVFARGTDNLLKYRIQNGTAWEDWRSVPGSFSGAPALAAQDERLHIFVRSGTQVKYRFYDEDKGWNSDGVWRDLEKPVGVDVVSDPVTQFFDGRMFVFVRGSDNQLYVRGLGEKGWSGWTKLAGTFTGTPSAAVANENTLFVFGRGSDGAVRYHSLAKGATGWAQYRTLDANIGGSPSAISFGGLMSVYARNGAGELIYRTFDANGWAPWRELSRPTATTLDSSPVTMKYNGVRIAAARGADQQLYIRNFSATGGWSAWTLLPGTHAPMS